MVKKFTREEIDKNFLQACYQADLKNVVMYAEMYNANLNCYDPLHYARALIYALRGCSGVDSEGELIVKYLVNKGAEINFKHGDKWKNKDSQPYFIYHAVTSNANVSDDLVYFLLKKGALENIDYVPTTEVGKIYGSAREEIRKSRPNLYNRLIKEKLISSRNGR
jgi:hypothetical protein